MSTALGQVRSARWLRVRIGAVALVFAGLLGAIGVKAYRVQIVDGDRMSAMGRAQYLQDLEQAAPRGSIHDRNGVELAVSVAVDSVWANPRAIKDVAATSRALADVLGLDVRELESKLSSDRMFVWLARRVGPTTAESIRALALPGIALRAEPKRFYPGRDLAGPLIGLAGLDGKGIEGVELKMDEVLAGAAGSIPAMRDARGKLLYADGWDDGAVPGATVELTIDRFIQYAAERALADAVKENDATAGIVVAIDPRTGEVLASAVWPTFDPNEPGKRKDVRNRFITDEYEPGSVMKVFALASAVEAGVANIDERIDVEGGKITVGNKTWTDTHKGENVITVGEVMKFSSNVGSVKIARRLGKERLHAALARFGFGKRTGIELPGERSGRLRPTSTWGEVGFATISFGYGLTATPIQLARALAAIANDGVAMEPTLIARVKDASGKVISQHTPHPERVLSSSAARDTRTMLRMVMDKGGTGEKILIPGFAAAGKTGTAYKVDPATGRYGNDLYLSSFMGFVPADDPRLAIVVMIDEPKNGKHYGGAVAGPVFARVAGEALRYLGVPGSVPSVATAPVTTPAAGAPEPDAPPVDATAPPVYAARGPRIPRPSASRDLSAPVGDIVMIPDFAGMSVGQAIEAAREAGVKVTLEGSGRATEQFPAPGKAVKSITCRVTFDPG